MPMLPAPSTAILNGRYQVQRTLHGGMGRVMICIDLESSDQRLVAIKTLLTPKDNSSALAEALAREAEAWLRLGESDNTFYLGLNRVASVNGQVYLVMPYCPKGNLRDRMQHGLWPTEALRYATQILIGLWQLEESGIIHRDLKPENVLFDSDNRARLSDLGIARFREQQEIAFLLNEANPEDTTVIAGTLPYMAPEQLAGRRGMDSGVDMWALGVLILEMLTGERPFHAISTPALVHAIQTAPPRGIDQLDSSLPKELPQLLSRLLEKDRTKRFPSFRDVVTIWDQIVRVSGSPSPSGLLRRDRRVPIEDALVETYWNGAFFPERLGDNVLVKWSVRVLKALKECSVYYNLDQYEKSIDAADEVLGGWIDPAAPLTHFINGDISARGSFKSDPLVERSSRYVAGAEEVLIALEWRFKSAVAVLSTPDVDPAFIADQIAFCQRVLCSPLLDAKISGLIAQVLALEGRAVEAESILRAILENNPKDSLTWNTLFFSATSAGEMKYARDIADDATPQLIDGGFHAWYVLAHMWGVLQEWKQSIHFASLALNERPEDVECLFMVIAALANAGRKGEAQSYYEQMCRVAPNHPKTLRLRKLFPGD